MGEVDYYDVQNMIRDARNGDIADDIRRAVSEAKLELRSELDELAREMHGIERVLNARTEHLA